jgi:hypothetical protein
VLPLGDGAILLGGGETGWRRISAEEKVTANGAASPTTGAPVWIGPKSVAWVEPAGVRWLSVDPSSPEPVTVTGLGTSPVGLVGEGDVLYGVDATGLVRAARVGDPGRTLWSVALGGKPTSPLVLAPATLLALVEGGVVAVER